LSVGELLIAVSECHFPNVVCRGLFYLSWSICSTQSKVWTLSLGVFHGFCDVRFLDIDGFL
jgi:hypothetical protein